MTKRMSLDLHDFRGKVTLETKVVLDAKHRISGTERSEIVRKVLHEWALQQLKEAKVMESLMRVEGISGADEGR